VITFACQLPNPDPRASGVPTAQTLVLNSYRAGLTVTGLIELADPGSALRHIGSV